MQPQLSALDGNICAVLWSENSYLGIAGYDCACNEIVVGSLHATFCDLERIIFSVKSKLQITIFVIHPSMTHTTGFVDILNTLNAEVGQDEQCDWKCQKSTSWTRDVALETIHTKLSVSRNARASQAELRLGTIDLYDSVGKQALGALVAFLVENVFTLDSKVSVNRVRDLQLESYMLLSKSTLECLQIFQIDRHPNVVKGKIEKI